MNIYYICMAIGIIIPLISFILNGIFDVADGILDGLGNAFSGMDGFGSFDGLAHLVPVSMQAICAGLLVFGTIGVVFTSLGAAPLLINGLGILLGYFSAVLIQYLIRRLKKVENTTYTKEQLLLFDAKVVNSILAGSYGSISIITYDGIASTYPAKAEDKTKSIHQDSIVRIVRFEKNVAIVCLKDESDKKYS